MARWVALAVMASAALLEVFSPGFMEPSAASPATAHGPIGFTRTAPQTQVLPQAPRSQAAAAEPRMQRLLGGALRFGAVAAAAVVSALPRRNRRSQQQRPPVRGMAAGLAATLQANWKAFSRTDACVMLRLSTLNFCKIYMAMLVLRITIMWFPNINPYRQPFYSMIQLTDPYLNLFRGWMPPIFGIDLSVILAFVVIQSVIDGLTVSPF
ncbi:unnamed protein product [Effrenium voratum]|nr:unnamed protein product [Effrenium voratum]